ncbi:MAG: putative 4-hydroxybenzoate polyprenyltransferase [Firmicutes bacterium]|nr:putative 4-hydroxybenzoate polyprenyltransferase [Bacillota bacterium]MCL5057644.1 putative 4-hydroxybenzoate polyprenyltransferase [Actinomycetota bacterium]
MVFKKLKIFFEMIKIEHTLFALPFAYIGALLVAKKVPAANDLVWITLAMAGARTAAMSLNRIIDRHIDAKNPRTAGRAIPRGMLSVVEVWIYTLVSFGLLLFSAYNLSPLAFKLFPVALAVLFIYPYTKRFTWLCHLILGLALGLAPLGAWVAIAGRFDTAPLLLAAGVMFWVAGFDIIYACDDFDFDRAEGVHSIPARFGIKPGLQVSSAFHVAAIGLFVGAGLAVHLGVLYFTGMLLAAALLFYQHRLIGPEDLSRSGMAFFNLNAGLSISTFIFTLADILVK